MKKTLIYALALALALSLTACGQPKAEQPTDPAPGTSTPEPIATPEPIKDTAPEQQRNFQNKKPLHNLPLSAIMKQETAEANKGRA